MIRKTEVFAIRVMCSMCNGGWDGYTVTINGIQIKKARFRYGPVKEDLLGAEILKVKMEILEKLQQMGYEVVCYGISGMDFILMIGGFEDSEQIPSVLKMVNAGKFESRYKRW